MFWAIGEGGCAPEEGRQCRLELLGEGIVVVAMLDVVEDVIEDVENVETAAPHRRQALFVLELGQRAVLLAAEGLGESD